MWWAAHVTHLEVPSEKHYRCPVHDVFGFGTECWMPGCTAEVETGRIPCTQGPHHYNPLERDVSIGGKMLHVKRELAKLI